MGAYQAKRSLISICSYQGNGDVEKVQMILAKYPEFITHVLEEYHGTLFMHAVSNNRIQMLEYLLRFPEVDVNQQNKVSHTFFERNKLMQC